MKQFMDKDFLLSNETAKVLYHDYAAKMPILDYHCHINPQEIWEDRKFENITQVWLGGDQLDLGVAQDAVQVDEGNVAQADDCSTNHRKSLLNNPKPAAAKAAAGRKSD